MSPLQAQLPYDLTTFGLVLFGLTGVCFFMTGCVNPGVPPMPKPRPMPDSPGSDGGSGATWNSGTLPHPGEAYSLSRDTNRCARIARVVAAHVSLRRVPLPRVRASLPRACAHRHRRRPRCARMAFAPPPHLLSVRVRRQVRAWLRPLLRVCG